MNDEDQLIREFYSKYRIRYKSQLKISHKKNPHIVNLLNIINIMEFDGKVAKAFSNIHNNMDENNVEWVSNLKLISVNGIIQQIRSSSECLKNINKIFFIKGDVDKNGTVKIIEIARKIGYDDQTSKKIRRLLFHDIRNALSHIKYHHVYNNDGSFKSIIWKDMENISHEASYEKLFEIATKIEHLSMMYQKLYHKYFFQTPSHKSL